MMDKSWGNNMKEKNWLEKFKEDNVFFTDEENIVRNLLSAIRRRVKMLEVFEADYQEIHQEDVVKIETVRLADVLQILRGGEVK